MTASEEIADVELVPDDRALVHTPTPPPVLSVTPTVTASELVARLDVIRAASQQAMQDGIDYGRIPGVDKPTLLKPGAEKLGVLFQLDIQLDNRKSWGPGDHLTVESRATVFHAPTGARLGFGEGLCTTRERKYATRRGERVCPVCGKPAIIKGKAEYGGGYVCFKKRDGCGTKFSDGDPQIEGQQVGDVDNPDLPDWWNTIVKMAEKRARVDAVLAVTGASALFTQDADEMASAAPDAATPDPVEQPPFGPEYDKAQLSRVVGAACVTIAGGKDEGIGLFRRVAKDCGGIMPAAAAMALIACAEALNMAPQVEAPEVG